MAEICILPLTRYVLKLDSQFSQLSDKKLIDFIDFLENKWEKIEAIVINCRFLSCDGAVSTIAVFATPSQRRPFIGYLLKGTKLGHLQCGWNLRGLLWLWNTFCVYFCQPIHRKLLSFDYSLQPFVLNVLF